MVITAWHRRGGACGTCRFAIGQVWPGIDSRADSAMYCGALPIGGWNKLVGRWRSLLEWPEPLLLKDCAVRGEASPTSQVARMSCRGMTWSLPGATQQDTRVHYRVPVTRRWSRRPRRAGIIWTQACPGAPITTVHTTANMQTPLGRTPILAECEHNGSRNVRQSRRPAASQARAQPTH